MTEPLSLSRGFITQFASTFVHTKSNLENLVTSILTTLIILVFNNQWPFNNVKNVNFPLNQKSINNYFGGYG